jgi:hypothetical protein
LIGAQSIAQIIGQIRPFSRFDRQGAAGVRVPKKMRHVLGWRALKITVPVRVFAVQRTNFAMN